MIPEKAMTPPLGMITVAALCPASWTIRLIDHSFDELSDEDLRWADLVMISAMHAQRLDAIGVLGRAKALDRRTFVGGPWASTEPDVVLKHADHVFVGEAEEAFAAIAIALEDGTAQRLYKVIDKPDMTNSPVPRFDLLKLNKYTSMPVQFSRGCPFQCEFCDIITIYGRKPRAKEPAQVIRELDTLRALGWKNEVFIVDDNFIGNHHKALALSRELGAWQVEHNHPFSIYTEASIDQDRAAASDGRGKLHVRIYRDRDALFRGAEGVSKVSEPAQQQCGPGQDHSGGWAVGAGRIHRRLRLGRRDHLSTPAGLHRTHQHHVGDGGSLAGAADNGALRPDEVRRTPDRRQ
jgi:hypothetical protein